MGPSRVEAAFEIAGRNANYTRNIADAAQGALASGRNCGVILKNKFGLQQNCVAAATPAMQRRCGRNTVSLQLSDINLQKIKKIMEKNPNRSRRFTAPDTQPLSHTIPKITI